MELRGDKGGGNEVERGQRRREERRRGGEEEGRRGGEEERRRGGEEERRRARWRTEWRIAGHQRNIGAEAGDGE